jgi:iron-sulfur cluster repair protein YtfE (RIC family)
MIGQTPRSPSPSIPRIEAGATLNEILRAHPSAAAVFNAFGIDACCGGARPLAAAAREDGVDLATLLAALEWDSYDAETVA